jgi:putative ABC transport system permease protein
MTGWWQDLRYAWRMLLKNPGFTALVIVVMGLGIGVNTSIFTIVRGVLLRGVPAPNPETLVALSTFSVKNPEENFEMSFPDFVDYRERSKTLTGFAVWTESQAYLTLAGEPQRFGACFVSPALFATLGIPPMLGTGFRAEEEQPGKQYSSVVISHRIWTEQLSSDPAVIGKTVKMNGRVRTIVGVMPPEYRFPETTDFWIPLAYDPQDEHRGGRYLDAMARLAPGATLDEAKAEIAGIAQGLAKEHPKTNDGLSASVRIMRDAMTEGVRVPMTMLLVAVGFVLLIACANVANLLLARTISRHRELSVRAALGAGRGRIARQLLTESVLIALLGGVLGVLIAYWSNDFVLAAIPIELPYWMKFDIDGPVLLYTMLLSAASGILFGLAPVLQWARPGMYEGLKDGSLQAGVGRSHHRIRNGLVVAEMALAMVLLVGAGLMIRSFVSMQERRGGLDPSGVLIGRVTLPVAVYPEAAQRRSFFAELQPRLAGLPGVTGASAVTDPPLGNSAWNTTVVREGAEQEGRVGWPSMYTAIALPGYFATIGIPIHAGRDFTSADGPDAQRVVIVNQAAARVLWPGQNPLGKRLKFSPDDSLFKTVVGVVGDVRQRSEDERAAAVFQPHAQNSVQTLTLVIKTSGDPAALAAPVRKLLQARDPDLPFYDSRTFAEHVGQSLWEPRIYTSLMGAYSFIALVIAAVGIYGVMAFRVAQRTQEIGIRMALGAPQSAVVRMVVGQGMRLTVLGLGLGLAAAFGITRLMASMLFGVDPNDPPTFFGVAFILAASALLACWLPAHRASRVDPMTALRHE